MISAASNRLILFALAFKIHILQFRRSLHGILAHIRLSSVTTQSDGHPSEADGSLFFHSDKARVRIGVYKIRVCKRLFA